MKKLRWDPIAKEQITEIFNFYKTRYGVRTAKKITDAIRQSSKRLKEQPLLGFKEPLLLTNPHGYRSLIEGNYKIVYCLEKDNYIRIAAIFDCRQNPDKLSQAL